MSAYQPSIGSVILEKDHDFDENLWYISLFLYLNCIACKTSNQFVIWLVNNSYQWDEIMATDPSYIQSAEF